MLLRLASCDDDRVTAVMPVQVRFVAMMAVSEMSDLSCNMGDRKGLDKRLRVSEAADDSVPLI